MHFSTDGRFHKVVRITGPRHNLLAIEFAELGSAPVPRIEVLRPAARPTLQGEDVLKQVLAGVADANSRWSTRHAVRTVGFVPDDTPPATIYRDLAASIVDRLAEGHTFEPSSAGAPASAQAQRRSRV